MNKFTAALLSVTCLALPMRAFAQDEIVEVEPTPWYENNDQVPYPDNTGPLSTVSQDTAADIVNETEEDLSGALKGEITLLKRDDIVEVYSNGNLVEQMIKGTGGTGMVKSQSSSAIVFQPAGRPDLNCPAQDVSGWFGPCKVEEGAS